MKFIQIIRGISLMDIPFLCVKKYLTDVYIFRIEHKTKCDYN